MISSNLGLSCCRVVYLTGHLDRHRLEDKLLNDVVYIEIHDRDPLPASLLTGSAKDKVGMARHWTLIWCHCDVRKILTCRSGKDTSSGLKLRVYKVAALSL